MDADRALAALDAAARLRFLAEDSIALSGRESIGDVIERTPRALQGELQCAQLRNSGPVHGIGFDLQSRAALECAELDRASSPDHGRAYGTGGETLTLGAHELAAYQAPAVPGPIELSELPT